MFLNNLVEGGHDFFNFFKGAIFKKSLGNPDIQNTIYAPFVQGDVKHMYRYNYKV